MSDELDVNVTTESCDWRIAVVERALDTTTRGADLAEKMADFDAPQGRFRHAPLADKKRAREAYERELDAEREAETDQLHQQVRRTLPQLARAKEVAMQLPDAETAYRQANRERVVPPQESLLVRVADELEETRFAREFGDAAPSRVLSTYARAKEAGDVSVMRRIEKRHQQGGWPASNGRGDEEAAAVLAIASTIEETRAARVPDNLRTLEATLKRAAAVCQRAHDVFGVRRIAPHD